MGIHRKYFFEGLSSEVETSIEAAIADFEALGCELHQVDVPEIEIQTACRNTITFAEASSYHEADILSRPEDYGTSTRELLRLGLTIPATEYLAALKARRRIVEAFQKLFADIDYLISPATTVVAPPIGARELVTGEPLRPGLLRLTSPFNTVGFPALSMPCGFSDEGLPIGVQLAAAPGQEGRLLRLAHAYERRHDWAKRHPEL